MTKENKDQLAALQAKPALSVEETAVVEALKAAIEAEKVLEEAQAALTV